MEQIRIQLLGSFTVTVNGKDVSQALSVSKKGTALLQLLILQHGAPVSNQYLYETLWSGSDSRKPELALKTLVSRYRHDMSEYAETLGACIRTVREGYAFDTRLDINVDLFEVTSLMERLAENGLPDDEWMRLSQQLYSLYRGDLLADRNGSEIWAQSVQLSLHSDVFGCMYRYVARLMQRENYEEALSVCGHLLEVDCFDEKLHISLIDSLIRMGRVNDAMRHYKNITELYHKYLGARVPEAIRSFYTNILNADNAMDESLSAICGELRRMDKITGALVCEYGVFREIYMLHVRMSGRSEYTSHVVLIMLHRADGSFIEPNTLDRMMNGLQTILVDTLRKSDVVCRYSANKFALLLPTRGGEDCELVMERIKMRFYREFGRSDVIMAYRKERVEYVESILGENTG